MPASENNEIIQQKPIYVVFGGKLPGVYISFEEIIAQKIDAKIMGGLSWKKIYRCWWSFKSSHENFGNKLLYGASCKGIYTKMQKSQK